jgi:hypothetical protein
MRATLVSAPFDPYVSTLLRSVGTRKRKCFIAEAPSGSPVKLRSYWDGGSRDLYAAYTASGKSISIPVGGAPGFTSEPEAWTPAPGDVLIQTGTFNGKEATPRITFYR